MTLIPSRTVYPRNRLLLSIAVAAAAIVPVACGTTLPPAPRQASMVDYKYLIGPGDKLNVVVWRHPELSGLVQVRPDGKLATPLIEDLTAIGKHPAELGREIEGRLRKYLQDPIVTVLVQDFQGDSGEQIRVIGQAVRPAALPYHRKMTLLDVMISVGGITEFAAGNRAVLIRRGDEDNLQYGIRLRDLLKNGDVSANVDMKPGDVILIPESWF